MFGEFAKGALDFVSIRLLVFKFVEGLAKIAAGDDGDAVARSIQLVHCRPDLGTPDDEERADRCVRLCPPTDEPLHVVGVAPRLVGPISDPAISPVECQR